MIFRSSVALFLLVVSAQPTALIQLTMDQITSLSTEIVEGTVTGTYTGVTGQTIFTHYTVSVAQRWKGANAATVDVAVPGGLAPAGAWKDMRQSFAGVPLLQTGHEYLLFLWKGKSGPNQPVGLNQGIFEITPASGTLMAVRAPITELLLDAQNKPAVDHGIRKPLRQVRSDIKRVAAGAAR